MTEKKNIAVSVHQRLINRAKESGEDSNLLLIRFCNERFLYRLSVSPFQNRFLLKGASLFALWFDAPHCPTRDVDLLGSVRVKSPTLKKFSEKFAKGKSRTV